VRFNGPGGTWGGAATLRCRLLGHRLTVLTGDRRTIIYCTRCGGVRIGPQQSRDRGPMC
jgi:hypothetical protein